MNFKKYHVSKNLFDYSTTEIGSISTTDGSDVEYDYARRSDFIPVQAGVTYTFSGLGGNIRIFEYKPDKTYRNTNYLYTIPVEISRTGYIRIAGALTAVIPEIMLNTGSTALPYEPYSSEVWHDIPHYIMGTSTDTITTLPAVLYPNALTATVGLQGNMVQTGTPTPDSPIQPSECGERTGNLWDKGDTWENDNTDTRTFFQPDIALFDGNTKVGDNVRIDVKSNGYKYLVSITPNTSFTRVSVKHNGSTRDLPLGSVYGEFEANVPVTVSFIVNGFDPTTIGGISISNIMLNLGSTALPYEPYGVKIPILNNLQTTNVYLGEVQSTRNIYKMIFDGTENILVSTANRFYMDNLSIDYKHAENMNLAICSHYPTYPQQSRIGDVPDKHISFSFASGLQRLYLCDDSYNGNLTLFKQFLTDQYSAGNPFTIWYVLAEPTATTLNEPLRKIGDYADSVSDIIIPVTAGANTIDVDTTLKPSEVSVNYHGWHPVQSVHERENGAWT